MKQAREKADSFLEKSLAETIAGKKEKLAVMQKLQEKYGVPLFRGRTITNMDASTAELKDAEVYWVMDCLNEAVEAGIDIEEWFTDIEIQSYSKGKYEVQEVKFPLYLKMIEVSSNQWIGTISAKELVRWRGSILKYNKNIQRRLTTVVRGNTTYEKISLNNSSVVSMMELFKERRFVPNVITLNIDDEIYYEKESGQLAINKLDRFDLTDGYHRLVALSKVLEEDPSFDFNMELRITNFSDSKASHFIWQEEQRTIMPKRAISSYNMDAVANKITTRINESARCNLSGSINRGGFVDFAAFADMVESCYLHGMNADERKRAMVEVPPRIIAQINAITESDSSLVTKKFTISEVYMLVYACWCSEREGKDSYTVFDRLIHYDYSQTERRTLNANMAKKALKVLERTVTNV